jgi:hypothetical protein
MRDHRQSYRRSAINSARTFLVFCACLSIALPTYATDDGVGARYLLELLREKATPGKSVKKHISDHEQDANTLAIPNPILATGSDLSSDSLSPNAMALANQLGLIDQLAQLPRLKKSADAGDVSDWIEYFEAREDISDRLRGAEMDVNYVLAEIYDEQAVYNELLSAYSTKRDKLIAKTNAISFGTNGALWALCEVLSIPTVTNATYAIPSGITGILAGVIPSIASALTLKQVNGKNFLNQQRQICWPRFSVDLPVRSSSTLRWYGTSSVRRLPRILKRSELI